MCKCKNTKTTTKSFVFFYSPHKLKRQNNVNNLLPVCGAFGPPLLTSLLSPVWLPLITHFRGASLLVSLLSCQILSWRRFVGHLTCSSCCLRLKRCLITHQIAASAGTCPVFRTPLDFTTVFVSTELPAIAQSKLSCLLKTEINPGKP